MPHDYELSELLPVAHVASCGSAESISTLVLNADQCAHAACHDLIKYFLACFRPGIMQV